MIELKKCPACNASVDYKSVNLKLVAVRDDIIGNTAVPLFNAMNLAKCPTCDLVFLLDRLPPEDQLVYYSSGMYLDRHPLKVIDLEQREKKSQPFIDLIKALLERAKIKPTRHLDFGCASGNLLKAVEWSKVGVEISPRYVTAALASGLEVHPSLDTVEGLFGLITITEVLEHLGEPVTVLRELYDKTTEGGYILVSVPDLQEGHQAPISFVHLQAFSPRALKNIMALAGFEFVSVWHTEIPNKTLIYLGRKI